MNNTLKEHRQVCDGLLFRWLTLAGQAWLERNMERVNQLNVFPVPDGDTGTNMHLTMRKACEALAKLEGEEHVGRVVQAVAQGALMGARGNSGVILSQIIAGFAKSLKDLPSFGPQELAEACKTAIQYAYKAVSEPVEGTILTVSREGMQALIDHVEASPDISLRECLETLVNAGKESLKRTPDLLPILKDAGVVDSGGTGFIYIMEGMLRFLEGQPVMVLGDADSADDASADWQTALVPEDEGYGYDVQFLIHGETLDVAKVRADIEAMGWSTLVVGDETLIKVHVHVFNPAEPINYAISTLGAAIDDVVVENMQLQYQQYVEKRVARESGVVNTVEGAAVVTVVVGDGLRNVFTHDFRAAYIIHGGQTMNPSTEDFVAAINAVPNNHVILLPNNKNILMAAQQAAKITSVNKHVEVVASRTIPQGIGAMFRYINSGAKTDLEVLVEDMRDGIANVGTIEVTQATRSVTLDGVEVDEGHYIALLNGKLAVSGVDMSQVIHDALHKGMAGDKELVTLYYGEQESAESASALAEVLSEGFDGLEFEIINGGQPLYPYLISIE
ncbi:MAG: DAK2 domain-containing protein [Phototrophicaceae bacterium]|jgi:DAK2 domain fusion protein YloV